MTYPTLYISSGPTGRSASDYDPETGRPLAGGDTDGPIMGRFDMPRGGY
jgi:hypothetical protein